MQPGGPRLRQEGWGEGESAAPVGTNLQVCPPAGPPTTNHRRMGPSPAPREDENAAPVGTNLQVCPPAACPSSTTRPLGHPQRGPASSLAGTRDDVPCGSPVSPLHATSSRMGKARPTPYSRLGPNLAYDAPQKLSSLLSLVSSLGLRPRVSWLVEAPGVDSTSPVKQDPTDLASVGESDLWLARGRAARGPPLPQNDARSTHPGWPREGAGVRAKEPRPWGRTPRCVRPLRAHPQ
jgi:hypothetical protein